MSTMTIGFAQKLYTGQSNISVHDPDSHGNFLSLLLETKMATEVEVLFFKKNGKQRQKERKNGGEVTYVVLIHTQEGCLVCQN